MKDNNTNDNNDKLLGFCFGIQRTVAEISRELGISPASVSKKIEILKKRGLVEITKTKSRTFVKSKMSENQKKIIIEVLKNLKNKGGIIDYDDYMSLIPFSFNDPDYHDKFSTPLRLLWSRPKFVKQKVEITDAGKKFLEDNSSKK